MGSFASASRSQQQTVVQVKGTTTIQVHGKLVPKQGPASSNPASKNSKAKAGGTASALTESHAARNNNAHSRTLRVSTIEVGTQTDETRIVGGYFAL